MRELTDKDRLQKFMGAIAQRAPRDVRIYFTGGTTAVLMDWRSSTIDVDLRFAPEMDELLRAITPLKEELAMNIELASPMDFIPPLPGWEDRSLFIARIGKASFYHFDLYSQALAKIERGHTQDREDVQAMIQHDLVKRDKLKELYESIKPLLYRFPAIDVESFSQAVKEITQP